MVLFKRLISTLSFLFIFLSCGKLVLPPEAITGNLDASNYLKDKGAVLLLKGDWIYYPRLIVFPNDVSLIESIGNTEYFRIPGVWSKPFLERGFLSADGFATFRLKLIHNLKNQPLSFKVPEMETAYNLFIDVKLVSKNGVVSPIENNARPGYRPVIVDFVPENNESELLLQISNYHHRKGGPAQIISVGRTEIIHSKFEKEILQDMLLVGSILFMGVYHLFLFFKRKKDPYTYWFALACILISSRVFITGNKYLTMFIPQLQFEIHVKLSYLTFFLVTPVFCRYMYLMFQPYFPKLVYKLIFNLGIAMSTIVILTRTSFYTYLMLPYQIFTLTCAIFCLIIVVRAIRGGHPGSVFFLSSFLIFFATFVNDVLVNNIVIIGPLLAHYGIFTMFFFQSISIARNFSKGFVDAENLALELSDRNSDLEGVRNELTNLNEKLEEKVKDKTIELQGKLDQINKDLRLAKSIVNGLMTVPHLNPHLEIRTLFQPLADVGGDIFFIKKIQDGYVRVFLCDATGHGLQAALYTMMIQSEFERLNMVATKPNDLLYYLNQHFYDKNSDLQIYFPAIAVDFDFSQSIMRFAAAGMQNQVLQKAGGEVILLENTGPIIGILEQFRFGFQEVKIETNDRVFLFSDGIFEELNEMDGSAALQELMELITKSRNLPLDEIIQFISEGLFTKMNKHQWKDDVTLIVLEVGSYLR
ncbi:MAG: SpoIIE family protein phosphatase [Leptospira sp.]|nr:SpoIIE family protein phosphatase [Leptospira sp.]